MPARFLNLNAAMGCPFTHEPEIRAGHAGLPGRPWKTMVYPTGIFEAKTAVADGLEARFGGVDHRFFVVCPDGPEASVGSERCVFNGVDIPAQASTETDEKQRPSVGQVLGILWRAGLRGAERRFFDGARLRCSRTRCHPEGELRCSRNSLFSTGNAKRSPQLPFPG